VSDAPVKCLVEAEVAAELPGLRLWSLELEAGEGPSPPELRDRLRTMSSRFLGSHAVALRSKPIPHAYRVFYRHIGLDPDVTRVPVEAVVVERLKTGGFKSRSLIQDAQTVAIMETNVAVWALDADTITDELELRRAEEREPLGRGDPHALWLPEGRLVVADLEGPVAVLFGDVALPHAVTKQTTRTLLFAVQVEGVPAIHVSEALWTMSDIVQDGQAGAHGA
jgi:DNA/RNA-binding domain of Phe-tRNA-synthetase-like protein